MTRSCMLQTLMPLPYGCRLHVATIAHFPTIQPEVTIFVTSVGPHFYSSSFSPWPLPVFLGDWTCCWGLIRFRTRKVLAIYAHMKSSRSVVKLLTFSRISWVPVCRFSIFSSTNWRELSVSTNWLKTKQSLTIYTSLKRNWFIIIIWLHRW